MNNGKWICLIFAAIMLLPQLNARCSDTLNRAIIDEVFRLYNLDKTNTEIEIVKNRIKIEDNEYDSLLLESMTLSEPRGLLPLRVSLFKNGELAEKGQIRIRIRFFETVLVSNDKIRRNKVLSAALFQVEKKDVTYLKERPLNLTDISSGFRFKRTIGKDQILTSGMIEKIPILEPGNKVVIVCKTAGMEISASGVAMESGYSGDVIRVKNNHSKKIISCTIVDNETVQVALR